MNRESIELEKQLTPKTEEENQAQMLECESFSRNIFTKIVKTFIKDQLLPKIKQIIEQYIGQLKLV